MPAWAATRGGSHIECYLVGGAVRDRLLGLPVLERDWVVVGATPEQMEAAGYRPVGRDFPVFLHPTTGEEYALARTERKTAPGHQGFSFHADPGVTLEQDLVRRDLTVNAMAEAPDGRLIDPFGGLADLEARRLRHVSGAFVEDPLRVLRVARFAARFASLGFRVVDETLALMERIAVSGELGSLSPERVWKECVRALATDRPLRFFQVLAECRALPALFPELAHTGPGPVGDALHPAWRSLEVSAGPGPDPAGERWAALMALAARDQQDGALAALPARDPDARERVELTGRALRVPRRLLWLGGGLAEHLAVLGDPLSRSPEQVLEALEGAGLLRQGDRLSAWLPTQERMLAALEVPEHRRVRVAALLQRLPEALTVSAAPLRARGLSGPALGEAIRDERVRRLAALLKEGT